MSLIEIATPDEAAAIAVPYSVRLAARRNLLAKAHASEAVQQAARREERRAYERRAARDLHWLRSARFTPGRGVSLVDLSEGGALLDVDMPLKPGARLVLELEGDGGRLNVLLSVLRSHVAHLRGEVMIYRGACEFQSPVDLATLVRPLLPVEPASEGPVDDTATPEEATSGLEAAPHVPAVASAGWQKIVVRYRDGRLLKGYTQDFHPSRGHFSLWPGLAASRNQRVIVPFSRLKAVFFVRDFAGNHRHVESVTATAPATAGRPVEVTFVDHEVVRGTTLSYRPDGTGFFVSPADSSSNNQRIFVVQAALRQVRFP